ncbi:hypothetical protein AAF712_011851 [Marasmius tenuissimus]|uniref:Uncharacterized protein n=1 Tax=Marasmius tenuissimus TaxID=585030 RepID=A0ABR2ZK33_9AGAR
MHARTTGLLSVAALLGAASATVVSFEARDITPISSLVARQSTFDPSVIPSQCQNQCSAVVGDIQNCQSSTDALCGCTTQVSGDMRNCFNCLVNLAPSAQTSIQGSYDDYIKTCNSAGANLPSGTIGGSGSVGGASGSATAGGGSSATKTVGGGPSTPTSSTGSGSSGNGSSGNGSTGNGSTGNGSTGNGSTGNSNSGNSGNSSSAPGGGNGALSARGNMAVVGGLCAAVFVFLL